MKACLSLILLLLLSFCWLQSSGMAQNSPSPSATPGNPSFSAPTAPAGPAGDEDIQDIRGPIHIPYPWMWILYPLGALACAGLGYALWKYLRRPAVVRVKDPFEIAIERLDSARELMVAGKTREYSFEVSELTRDYIERRFNEKAARKTTEEFLYGLLDQIGTPLSAHRPLLEDFLRHCDMAKYAGWQLSDDEMASMHESAHSFLLATRPQPLNSQTPVASAATS